MGIDGRLLQTSKGPPKWLALEGYGRCTGGGLGEIVHSSPRTLAPSGFTLFSRFCRGLSVVSMGLNVDHDGDVAESKHGTAAAMYFVVAVEASEEEMQSGVEMTAVSMHRSVGSVVSMLFDLID